MYHQPKKNKVLFQRIFLYSLMTLSVLVIVSSIAFFIMGYRYDVSVGKIEQHSMVQFHSVPSGAKISIDGVSSKMLTPNKATLPAGRHVVSMEKDGYNKWTKEIETKAGSLLWLSHVLLVPEKIETESVMDYSSIYQSLTSPDNKKIIYNLVSNMPYFEVVDVNSNNIQISKITITQSAYSESYNDSVNHVFNIVKWDDNGRYVLVKHLFADSSEWLLIDIQDVNFVKNITRLFDFPIDDIKFLGTGGNTFYVYSNRDIRKINLSAGTISRPLISGVDKYHVYNSEIISYIGDSIITKKKDVGIYRDGDDNPYVIKSIDYNDSLDGIYVSASRYFGQYYLALSVDGHIELYSGSYPSSGSEVNSFKLFSKLAYEGDLKELGFSPSGQFVLAKFIDKFISYDIEYQNTKITQNQGDDNSIGWLNDKYLWNVNESKLSILEFDGQNATVINQSAKNQAVCLTVNNRYIYSFKVTDTGYQLQRTKMLLSV